MNKLEFLKELEKELSGLSKSERDEHINFYSEMIDDRIEDGLSEDEAIKQIGTVEHIVSQIVTNKYYTSKQKNPAREKKSMPVWAIVLLAAGSPLWLVLVIVLFSVLLSIEVSIWSVIASFWAIFGSFALAGPIGVIGGILFAVFINPTAGIALVSAGLVLSGLAILAYFGCFYATKGSVMLTVFIFKGIINCFRGKEKGNA